MKRALLLLTFVLSSLASGKPLYLTIRRDFAPNERAVVEWTYSQDLPARFRIYRPKDAKAFLAKQIDVRRSWQEPKTEINSARLLMLGFNRTFVDFDWVRTGFSEGVRDDLKEKFGGGQFRRNATPIPEGPQKLIRGPEGFEYVTEFTVSPTDIDSSNPFDVPGFNWYFAEQSGFKTRLIDLPELPVGFYLLQILQGANEGQVAFVVNDIRALAHQTDNEISLMVSDRRGYPLKDAKVSLRNLNGDWFANATSDKSGVVKLDTKGANEIVAVIESEGKGTAMLDGEFHSTSAEYPDLYLYSDRPMYKTTGEVNFKGIYRNLARGVSQLLQPKDDLMVQLIGVNGKEVGNAIPVKTNEYGSFSGSLPFSGVESGVYRVQASHGTDEAHLGEVRVKDYVKPLFFLKISTSQESIRPGQSLKFSVKAERYAGGPAGDLDLRAELFQIKDEGPEWAEDAGMGITGNAATYFWDDGAKQPQLPVSISVDDTIKVNAAGVVSVALQVPAELPKDDQYEFKYLLKISAKDSEGNFAQSSQSFSDSASELLVQTQATHVFVEQGGKAQIAVRTLKPSGAPLTGVDGQVALELVKYDGSTQSLGNKSIVTGENGKWSLDVPTTTAGEVVANFKFKTKSGLEKQASSQVIVADNAAGARFKRVSNMSLLTRKTNVRANDSVKILALLPEKWGEDSSDKGRIYVTVANDKIFDRRVIDVKGQSAWIEQKIEPSFGSSVYLLVSYSDPEVGWVERKVSFRVLPEREILQVNVNPEFNLVEPGKEQKVQFKVTGFDNKPLKAELSVSVVDRAVLDLQPEFRPNLLDFFYPPIRLNVMSYLSGDFQAYGYGEPLAALFKPNYSFAATKPDPEEQKENDTAYWNAHVVTDDQGLATVAFRLPSNQTIWNVSAVAVDKEGRFGEGKSEFKAQTEAPIIISAPTSVRQGDDFQLRMRFQNLSLREEKSIKVAFAPTGPFKGELAKFEKTLKPKETALWSTPVSVDPAALGVGKLVVDVSVNGTPLQFSPEVIILDATSKLPYRQEFPAGRSLTLDLADGEFLSQPRVLVTEGFSGTVMSALDWLVRYPYGCAEQTTSASLPNLALASLLAPSDMLIQEAGLLATIHKWWSVVVSWFNRLIGRGNVIGISDSLMKELVRAKEFGRAGVDKLGKMQIKSGRDSGGFGVFDGLDASTYATIMVLESLVALDDREMVKDVDLSAAFNFLTNGQRDQELLPPVLEQYLEARLVKLGVFNEYRTNISAQRNALETALNAGDAWSLSMALMMVQAMTEARQKELSGERQKVVAKLTEQLKNQLSASEDTNLRPAVWSRMGEYPSQTISIVALAARALYQERKLDSQMKLLVADKLMSVFNGEHFGSTFETGRVLLHSTWLIQDEMKERRLKSSPTVQVAGQNAKTEAKASLAGWELTWPSGTKMKNSQIKLDGVISTAKSRVVGEKTTPLSQVKAESQGMSITRSWYRVDEATRKPIPLTGVAGEVKVGDLIYQEIEFKRQDFKNFWPSRHYVLSIDVPAGFEVIDKDDEFTELALSKEKTGWIKRGELNGRLNYYFEFARGWMDPSNRGQVSKIGALMRANYSGKIASGVAKLEDFYDESIFGRTDSRNLSVGPAN